MSSWRAWFCLGLARRYARPVATTLTQAELELQFSAETVRRFFTDDGGPDPDEALVMAVLERADAAAIGLLMKGGTAEWARQVLANDANVRGYAYDIAGGMMGARRQEFQSNGNLYAPGRTLAEKALERIGAAEIRAKGEATAGANAHVGMTVKPSPTPRVFRYADGRSKGGF